MSGHRTARLRGERKMERKRDGSNLDARVMDKNGKRKGERERKRAGKV